MMSRRTENGWGAPAPVAFAGQFRDLDAAVSPDGARLYFQSDRPAEGDSAGDWNIWTADRAGENWSVPYILPAPYNSPAVEIFPVPVAGGSLYLSTARDGLTQGLDVVKISPDGDISVLPPPVNTDADDSNVLPAPDQGFLIIGGSNYPGHLGNGDLFISYRDGDGWTDPKPVPGANSPHREFAPALSPDGKWLYFTSNRPLPGGGETRKGDIYRIRLPRPG